MPLQVQQVKPKQVWQKYTNLWFTEKKKKNQYVPLSSGLPGGRRCSQVRMTLCFSSAVTLIHSNAQSGRRRPVKLCSRL